MNELATNAPDVVLLHSNDIHSRLEQAARMAAYIEEIRSSHGAEHVLTLDIGDHMDRMRVETEASDGLANIALLNDAGYDAVTIGNNEGLTFTQEQLDEAFGKHARFQTVCANFFNADTKQRPSWMRPSTIINKAGIRFGLIGVSAAFVDFYGLLGWVVTDPLHEVAEQVKQLRSHVDVLIIMSHLGITLDRRMAQEIPGIDLILGGHTHHLLEEAEVIGSTHVCAAGKFGEYMGRVDIWFDSALKRPRFKAVCTSMEARALQLEATAIIGGFKAEGERRLSRIVAVLDAPLALTPERESPLGNLLAAGLRRWTKADIGIVNAGQLLRGLAAGEVTAGDLHALCPSPINPCRMQLSGTMIRLSLEEALLPEYIDKPIRGFGFRGLVLGTLAVDGLTIEYMPDNPAFNKIVTVLVNGEPLLEDKLYVVGTIDMFTFGIGYEKMKNGLDIAYYLPEFIRGVLEEELQDTEAIADSRRTRWQSV
ncbi:bifunctional UDP-sugar hydrolase/5'-nucleotidase [Paenibacillus sp. OV219]|uniref:bifunctional metallophosphatase/5'-nucleotidase n=1 Tax=Paenibacillus sp. OV219 TaxID=1884377 RepID=UPI0008D19544|nr:bifunctional UDP-sugar hydrolase/5'-nucleotidase [Paenibacillus sp. OV219]SEO22167.1 2',3'-cyclic-nucleotide 2'-phosphodiesterase/5'-or 3'-nucleotidase, 5'-nucleotidase family [Paenibacillus sp. OV219]